MIGYEGGGGSINVQVLHMENVLQGFSVNAFRFVSGRGAEEA